ncbi:branched-chain amino acid aminotransferase II [Dentipellis sp. KUC8613]|nr:branched-chain amino acid aminotransferase II [Dentipellis sp. KUC8613]
MSLSTVALRLRTVSRTRAVLGGCHLKSGARLSAVSGARYNSGVAGTLPDIRPDALHVRRRSQLKQVPPLKDLKFGHNFTDHMLTIPWTAKKGWGAPVITEYGPLSLDPSCTVFHYAQCLFEGLKAYRNNEDKITLFRPDMNMKRMNRSAERLALPTFDGEALLHCIKQLILVDKHWIPQEPGHSLYIRPVLIGTQESVGICPPDSALLYVICSPVGPYYPDGFKPVALYGTTEFVRASLGGTGEYKIGANYAPGVHPQKKAAEKGYVQNLWLHGPEHHLTEVGTMNLFTVFRKDDGTYELVTPPLDGMILPGVTRDSLLELARGHQQGKINVAGLAKDVTVSERPVTMKEIIDAANSGRLVEMFGSGTAAVVSPVNRIGYLGQDVHIPVEEDGMGPVSRPLWKELVGRQMGDINDNLGWSVVVE